MDAIVEYLKSLPKDFLLSIVYQLMVDGNLPYHELMDLHIQNIERMRRVESEAYFRLQAKVVNMWADHKKNLQKNLKEAIQLLKDEGRVNITQDIIDKYFKEK